MSLLELRDSLAQLNIQLLSTISERRHLVEAIQKIKIIDKKEIFDPEQEWKVFSSQRSLLSDLNMQELFAFSIIAESQVSSRYDYPRWSNSEHLAKTSGELFEKINPVLLSQLKPDLISDLEFKDSYKYLSEFLKEKLRG